VETADIAQMIRDKAEANGVDPSTLLRFGQVESGLNPNAAASGSSAKGLFQFTDPAWKDWGNGGDPLDPVANADAAARRMKDSTSRLSAVGLDTSPGSLYLSHFAGQGGAQKLLTADPSAPVSSILSGDAIRSNPFLGRMTVADLKNWASGKVGGGPTPATLNQSASAAAPMAAPTPAPALPGASSGAPAAPEDATPISLPAQQQAAPEAPTPLKLQAPPPRRIDRTALLKLLSTPLNQRGFS
jgi:hypothetical protein